MIWNEALEKICFTPLSVLDILTELLWFFCLNFIVQIPPRGIIVKLQILLSEIEEREGNERWLLSLTPPRRAAVSILSSSSGNKQDFVEAFLISFSCVCGNSTLQSWYF